MKPCEYFEHITILKGMQHTIHRQNIHSIHNTPFARHRDQILISSKNGFRLDFELLRYGPRRIPRLHPVLEHPVGSMLWDVAFNGGRRKGQCVYIHTALGKVEIVVRL